MVYDSDFYTTRRPYRSSPAYSSYTTSYEPSRQVKILPGLGKVHIVHSYDRIVPYVGHKRLTVVTSPPKVFSTRPSVLHREYDWIENKVRPRVGYSATNRYLNSDSAVRIYYSSYPISSSYYTTLSLPSSYYYPKAYRWYYDWPRTYTSYWPSYYSSYWPTYYSSYYPSSYYSYWPYSYYSSYWPYYRSCLGSFFRNYYLSSSPSLYYRSLDYQFSELENKINNLSRMIYLNYPYRTLDYYPETTRYFRPLTLYYNYYYPIRSLNYYSDVWPYYPYHRYLYYKYTLPSDRYYHLKSRIVYLPSASSGLSYRLYPTPSYIRNKIYRPLGLYCDYYEPIRSLYWNSSYWPLYRSVSSFRDELPSERAERLQKIFDSETSLIRAQTNSLLRRIHDPVPRVSRLNWPLSSVSRYYNDIPARYTSDNYIQKILITSPYNAKTSYTTYYSEPIRKYIGTGHLASVSYAGGRAYDRRPYIYLYENPLQNDIQLLSYYINKFKQEKAYSPDSSSKVPLSPARPSRRFGPQVAEQDEANKAEIQKLREARAARLAFINEEEKRERVSSSRDVDEAVRAKKEKEEARALAEEQARQETVAKQAARKAEIARQEELAAKAAAERAAELEKQAELARQAEAKKQAEIEKRRREEEEEKARLEEQRRIEEANAEEALQAQLRLEEIARKAEEEKEADLARQAEELAELARQEAELAEQAKIEAEEEERKRQEAELEELKRQEEELAELERQEKELAVEAARAKEEAEAAKRDAEIEELRRQEEELAELERAQAELDALEAEAKAFESDLGPPPAQSNEPEPEEVEEEEEAPAEKEPEPEPVVDEAELARQAELEELRRDEEELAELERAQAELDALEAEAKLMESDLGPPPAAEENEYDDDEPEAIAEDVPGVQSDEEED
ncbi:uncharacterized protein CG45076-like isoform X2 [Sitophilus oryzae]|uniref:Uncharacterized protein CG45076-like isoform X2 n=1 Tax=Sitophilus oryzae TaxID=7048 RepID=A0A6J2XWZ8_SITOR|nr:uncharacterized protein CG45076-like isoform X2 [Sitophilus oryzae]